MRTAEGDEMAAKTTENGGGLSLHTVGDSIQGANMQGGFGPQLLHFMITSGDTLTLHLSSIHCSNHVQAWTTVLCAIHIQV